MYQHRSGDTLTAMSATSDPDTMYYHQAMREPDSGNFVDTVKDEFGTLLKNGIFRLVEKSLVPEGMTLFPAVWAMKRKRRVKTQEIYKWKARLNLDGSKMTQGQDYDQTYAPVASWESIRLLLALVLKNNWKTRQLDYVLAFPQAPVEREMYMQIPKGIRMKGNKEFALKVEKNIYGQKQAGRVWNQHLVRKLINESSSTMSASLRVYMTNAYSIEESPSTYSTRTIPYWPDQMMKS